MATAIDWTLDFSSGIPVYKQIINFIYYEIGSGNFRIGDRLPTIKELTEKLNVNPNTVAKAYRELDMKGVITSKRGMGCFISALLGGRPNWSDKEKEIKMDELFGKLISEASAFGITEKEILTHVCRRLKENGQD